MTAHETDKLLLEQPRIVLEGVRYEIKLLTVADELALIDRIEALESTSPSALERVEGRLRIIRDCVVDPDAALEAALRRASLSSVTACMSWLEWADKVEFVFERKSLGKIALPDESLYEVYEQNANILAKSVEVSNLGIARELWARGLRPEHKEQDRIIVDGEKLADWPFGVEPKYVSRSEMHVRNIEVIADHIEGLTSEELLTLPPMVRRHIEQNALDYLYGERREQQKAQDKLIAAVQPLWEHDNWRQVMGSVQMAVEGLVQKAGKNSPPS